MNNPQSVTQASFAVQRERMIEDHLRKRGITDPRVLDAMRLVPRELFVPPEIRHLAYEDGALSIGLGQTISQPFTVAFMCQAAALCGDERILEVGTGSGYGAAVLSHLAREVYTIETIGELADAASERLQRLDYRNVQVFKGDGSLGLSDFAPYEAIVVTAGGSTLPAPYAEQLSEGGRVVIPLGDYPGAQSMYRFTRRDGKLIQENLGGFSFVPLVGEYGWSND